MKVLKVLSFAVVLFFATNSQASSDPNRKTDVRKEISDILSKMELESETFMLNFIVNDKGELVIISTSSQKSDKLVRESLNYKKVGNTNVDIHTIYSIPITIEKSKK
jgi:hypothetical protein